jgi:hypothetical protein
MGQELTKKDRSRLRKAAVLGYSTRPAWMLVPADVREQGQTTFKILVSDR